MEDKRIESEEKKHSLLAFGQYLSETRRMQGYELEDITALLKINLATLQAIEAGNIESLPHFVYTKGFIRTYAHFLGIKNYAIDAVFKDIEGEESYGLSMEPLKGTKRNSNHIVIGSIVGALGGIVLLCAVYYQDIKSSITKSIQNIVSTEDSSISLDKGEHPETIDSIITEQNPLCKGESLENRLSEHIELNDVQLGFQEKQAPEASTLGGVKKIPLNANAEKIVTDAGILSLTKSEIKQTEQAHTASTEKKILPKKKPHETEGVDPLKEGTTSQNKGVDPEPIKNTTIADTTATKKDTPAQHIINMNKPGRKNVIVLKGLDECWIHSTADSSETRQFYIQQGQVVALSFADTLVLKLGNAAGVEIKYNGEKFPVSGKNGQVKTITLPPSVLGKQIKTPRLPGSEEN